MVMLATSVLSTGTQFRKQAKSLTASKLLLVHPQEKHSQSVFLQIQFCFLHMQLCLLGHMMLSDLMADLIRSSLLLKASKVRSSCSRLCPVKNLKGHRIHSLSGQSVPALGHPYSEEVFSFFQLEYPLL